MDFWVDKRLKHMIRLSQQNGGVYHDVDKVVEKVCVWCREGRRRGGRFATDLPLIRHLSTALPPQAVKQEGDEITKTSLYNIPGMEATF